VGVPSCMEATGQTKFRNLPKPFAKAQRLNEKLIGRGDVLKTVLVMREKRFSVSLLFLAPNSCVCRHKHDDSREFYSLLEGHKVSASTWEMWPVGCEHELVNTSKENWLVIILKKLYS